MVTSEHSINNCLVWWVAQRGWFDSHNQIEIGDENIVKILTIFYVSNTDEVCVAKQQDAFMKSYNNQTGL